MTRSSGGRGGGGASNKAAVMSSGVPALGRPGLELATVDPTWLRVMGWVVVKHGSALRNRLIQRTQGPHLEFCSKNEKTLRCVAAVGGRNPPFCCPEPNAVAAQPIGNPPVCRLPPKSILVTFTQWLQDCFFSQNFV